MLPDELIGWLDAAAEFGEDLPDGAWLQHMEDSVRGYNQTHHTRFEPNKTVMAWIESKQD